MNLMNEILYERMWIIGSFWKTENGVIALSISI